MSQSQGGPTPKITIDELDELLRTDAAVLVDVREEAEVRRGHVPGALHIPLAWVHGRATTLPRDRRIAVICQSGNRSRTGADMLIRQGLDAVSVAGGTSAWARSGRAITMGATRVA